MKKTILSSALIAIILLAPTNAQVGKFLKNVKNNVQKDLLGTPGSKSKSSKSMPEPPCACDGADLIIDLGKYKIDYSESTISILDDGRILLGDRMTDNFYISNNGVVEGPYRKDDPRVIKFQSMVQDPDNHADLVERYGNYITKKEDKYLITFAGKTYGPFALISRFAITKSGDKFAALVTPEMAITEQESKMMEEKARNAKTDQEKMQIAMEYSQKMQKRMMEGGGPQSMQPKLISNGPVASGDDNTLLTLTGNFYDNLKYDDIVMISVNKITDLQGKTLMNITGYQCTPESMFIKSDNSGYACYMNGVLSFSDGKKLTEMFSPHLAKFDGKIFLAYFYYSPQHNALMQCRIPF